MNPGSWGCPGWPRGESNKSAAGGSLSLTVFFAVVGGHLGGGAVPPGLVVLIEAADCHPQAVVGQH